MPNITGRSLGRYHILEQLGEGGMATVYKALEWISDWYSESYYSASSYENPTGPENGSRHPLRGGSWWSGRDGLHPAARASKDLNYSSDQVGFRCAMDAP